MVVIVGGVTATGGRELGCVESSWVVAAALDLEPASLALFLRCAVRRLGVVGVFLLVVVAGDGWMIMESTTSVMDEARTYRSSNPESWTRSRASASWVVLGDLDGEGEGNPPDDGVVGSTERQQTSRRI